MFGDALILLGLIIIIVGLFVIWPPLGLVALGAWVVVLGLALSDGKGLKWRS